MCPRGQSTCKTFTEARIGIDAGADRGAAKCELQQTRLRRIEPFDAVADLACPARQLLVETDRHCIHQVRAAGLGHALELVRALLDGGREQLQRRLEFGVYQQGRSALDPPPEPPLRTNAEERR